MINKPFFAGSAAPIVVAAVAWLGAAQAGAATPVSAPGTLSKAGETYQLTSNIVASGTAFQITASGVIFDLNGYSITYNNSNGATSYGVQINASNVRVTNGAILQGASNSSASHAINLSGTGAQIDHLVIRVAGPETHGILAMNADLSSIHHIFVSSTSLSNSTGDPPSGIWIQARSQGGLTINDNIVVGAVRGVMLEYVGLNVLPNMPSQSKVFGNLLQPDRIYGSKGSYAILAARSSNVDIYNNQIVSDQGRGINLDGYDQGTSAGTTNCQVRNNLIDVQYSPNPRTGSGTYPENDVYGIRDRYGSGNNTITGNIIYVDNLVGGTTWGLFVGSDAYEASMKNITISSNKIVSRNSDNSSLTRSSDCISLDYAESISVTANQYQCAHRFIGYGWTNTSHVNVLTDTGNVALPTPTGTPAAPGNLRAHRFLDKLILQWDPTSSTDGIYEYRVYKDGQRVSANDIGGNFFVGTVGSGDPVYTVSTVNLASQESAQSAGMHLSAAVNGWNFDKTFAVPKPPTSVTVN